MPFESLGVAAPLARAVAGRGHAAPTPIQTAAIPLALQGVDLLALAHTGSGKTIAFALPLLQRWATAPTAGMAAGPRPVRALVLVPTRELAAQVGDTVAALGAGLARPPKLVLLFGGVSPNPQMLRLRGGADIVVATPGRLLDLVRRRALSLAGVECLVLDEADRLLDLGFADELAEVLALLPARRQNLLFSATLPPPVEALATRWLREARRVEVDPPAPAPTVRQRAIVVDTARRTPLLRHLIQSEGWDGVLVFVATKHATEMVADKLRKAGIAAEPFHGQLSQGKRTQVLADFKARRVRVVIATDLAARGIDIARLPVVVNLDLPRSAVDQLHRIGRTGRAGEPGLAISFVPPAAEAHFRLIEKRQGQAVPREQVEGFAPTDGAPAPSPATDGTGGIKGRRPSKKDKLRAAAAAARAGGGEPAP